ncbi:hypothetical protein T190130A13A_40137 [Tenacibaculum sp. 190130A14a]|uniref:Uncharacterized protein n=1 Tax=Tenacibaculum polynesiense TaxID=3137857 RepID=A0ABP1F532_9FLAO
MVLPYLCLKVILGSFNQLKNKKLYEHLNNLGAFLFIKIKNNPLITYNLTLIL